MALLYPRAAYKPVRNHGGLLEAHQAFVVHVAVGNGSLFGWFDNPASQASAHFWVSKSGQCEQYVDGDVEAWAEMAGNPTSLSAETEGYPTEPFTAAQALALSELIAWAHTECRIPLELVDHGGHGVTTHAHYPSGAPDPAWGDHPCPGTIRSAALPAILERAKALVAPTQEVPPMLVLDVAPVAVPAHNVTEGTPILVDLSRAGYLVSGPDFDTYALANGVAVRAKAPIAAGDFTRLAYLGTL